MLPEVAANGVELLHPAGEQARILLLAFVVIQHKSPALAPQRVAPSVPAVPGAEAEDCSGSQAAGGHSLLLAYFDAAGLSPQVRASMESEVEATFGEIGVKVHGIDGEPCNLGVRWNARVSQTN